MEEAEGRGEGAWTSGTRKGKEGAKARRGSLEHDRVLQRPRHESHGDGNVGAGGVKEGHDEGDTAVVVRLDCECCDNGFVFWLS